MTKHPPTLVQPRWKPIGTYRNFPLPSIPLEPIKPIPKASRYPYPWLKKPVHRPVVALVVTETTSGNLAEQV